MKIAILKKPGPQDEPYFFDPGSCSKPLKLKTSTLINHVDHDIFDLHMNKVALDTTVHTWNTSIAHPDHIMTRNIYTLYCRDNLNMLTHSTWPDIGDWQKEAHNVVKSAGNLLMSIVMAINRNADFQSSFCSNSIEWLTYTYNGSVGRDWANSIHQVTANHYHYIT